MNEELVKERQMLEAKILNYYAVMKEGPMKDGYAIHFSITTTRKGKIE